MKMAQTNPSFVNFSSDTYDFPDGVDNQQNKSSEDQMIPTEIDDTRTESTKLGDVNEKNTSDEIEKNNSPDDEKAFNELVPQIKRLESNVLHEKSLKGVVEEREMMNNDEDNCVQKLISDRDVDKHSPNISQNDSFAANDVKSVGDSQKIIKTDDSADTNAFLEAKIIVDISDSSSLVKNNTETIMLPSMGESEEHHSLSGDNKSTISEEGSEKKENIESVASDENNNEITNDLDIDDQQQNDDSFQLNSDRVYAANEDVKHITGNSHEPVYINLMKDALGGHNLMDRESQLTILDMDARLSARSETRPQTTSTMREVPGGLRAKANTPASLYMGGTETDSPHEDKVIESGRAASRASREEVFQRAMTLMSNRCTSAREDEDVLFSGREPPFGIHIPEYFYVYQKKPTPMAPLKAWRGYKGNVYFEPMAIKSMASNDDIRSLPGTAMSRNRSASRAPTRATTASMFKKSYRLVNSSPQQVVVLDKQTVVRSENYDIEHDLRYIEGMESTGSLAVRPQSSHSSHFNAQANNPGKQKDKRLLYKRERICKGSNFHNIQTKNIEPINNNKNVNQGRYDHLSSRKSNASICSRKSSFASSKFSSRKKQSSSAGSRRMFNQELMISGDKFALPTVMSPVLRNSTHFSLPDERPLLPTPDVYQEYNTEMTPSSDRIHVSIEKINISDENYSKTTSNEQNDSYPETVAPFIDISFKKATANTC